QHRGGAPGYFNPVALQRASVPEPGAGPPGGRFDRAPATKRLTGRAAETAVGAFRKAIPDTVTRAERREGVKIIAKMMSRTGLTSVHDAYGDPDDLAAYQDARAEGDLSVRVYCLIGSMHLARIPAPGIRSGY